MLFCISKTFSCVNLLVCRWQKAKITAKVKILEFIPDKCSTNMTAEEKSLFFLRKYSQQIWPGQIVKCETSVMAKLRLDGSALSLGGVKPVEQILS
jgi:hypothetical protein